MATQGPAKRDVPRGPQYATCAEVPFQRLSHFFGLVSGQIPLQGNVAGKGLPPRERSRLLRRFMELYMPRTHDTYEIMRLLAPDADRVQRGSYHLQHAKLAKALCMAANLPKGSEQESNVINWRTRGSSKFVGDFPEACHKYVLNMCRIPETALDRKLKLTVGMVNEKLDELASRARPNLDQKAETLKWFMQNTTSMQMKWIVCLILQNLKIGMAEETIIKHYHPDAFESWGLCQNLKTVCEELRDPNYHPPHKDVEPGMAIYPMLARVGFSAEDVYKKMQHGGEPGAAETPFVIETKFDGDRYLLHRKVDPETGAETIKYTSRQGHEHGVKSNYSVFDNVVKAQLEAEDLILDGEMLVWNKPRQQFEAFGSLRSAIQAAHLAKPASMRLNDPELMREGFRDRDGELLPRYSDKKGNFEAPRLDEIEIIYIAFDILYKGTRQSLTRLPLQERSEILRAAVKEATPEGFLCGPPNSVVRGRIISLIPGQEWGGRLLSQRGHTKEDISAAFDRITREDEEEGIVVKRLLSAWSFMHRSCDWVKLKPDYTKLQEIDALVIGASYGTGELRGGKLSEFLVALRVDGTEDEHGIPSFASFVVVATGLEEAERDVIRDKLEAAGLRPRLDPSTRKDLKNAPLKYRVTGNEVVDVWIEDPMKSVVLEVHGDVRPIMSKTTSTGFSLRFPRITRCREDKGPLQCQSIREFETMYEERKKDESERTGNAEKSSEAMRNYRKEMEAKRKKRKELIPAAFKPANLEGVQASSDALAGLKIGFYLKDKGTEVNLHKLVKSMQGIPYMNVTEKLDFVLAQEDAYGWKPFSRTARKDVLRIDWLLEPGGPNPGLPPRPWHYLYMCPVSRFQGYEWAARYFTDYHDRHGLPWYVQLDTEGKDLANLMERLIDSEQYQQALKEQDAASQRLAREREVLLEVGNGGMEQEGGEKQGPKTLDQIILDAEGELSGLGQSLPEMSLFRGKVVYVLDMGPEPPAHMTSLADKYAQQGQPAGAAMDEPSGAGAWGRSGIKEGGGGGATKLLQQLGYTVTQAGTAPSRHSSPGVEIMGESEGTDAPPSRPAFSGAGGDAQYEALLTPDMSESGIPHLDACGADVLQRMRAREQQLQDMHAMYIVNLKLKVEAHGGTVMSQLAKGVSHILLVPRGATSDNHAPPIPSADVVRALDQATRRAASASLLNKAAARHRRMAEKAAKGEPTPQDAAAHEAAAEASQAAAAAVEQAREDPLRGLDEEQRGAEQARAARLLKYVRRRLGEGRLHMVDWRWVQASLATLPPLLDLDAAGQPAPSVHTPAEGPGSETTAAKPVGGAAPAPAAAAAGPAAADTAADASTGAGAFGAPPTAVGDAVAGTSAVGPSAAAAGVTKPAIAAAAGQAPAAASGQTQRPPPCCLPESKFPPWIQDMAATAPVQDASGALQPAAAAAGTAAAAESVPEEDARLARVYAAWPWHVARGHEDGFGSSTSGTATAHLSSPLDSDECDELREAEQHDQQRRGLGGPSRGGGKRQQQRKTEERAPKAHALSNLSARAADPERLRALQGMTVKALKETLKARGLAVSGTKPELIDRLLGGGDGGAGRQKRKADEGKVPQHTTKPGRRRTGAGSGAGLSVPEAAMTPTPSSSRPRGLAQAAGAQEEGVEEEVEDLTLPAGSESEVEGFAHGHGEVLYEGSSELEDEEVRSRGRDRQGSRRGGDAGGGREGGGVGSTQQREGRLIPSSMVTSAQASVAAPSVLPSPAAGVARGSGDLEDEPPQPAGSRRGQKYVPLGVQRPKRFGLQRVPREQGVQRMEGVAPGSNLILGEDAGGISGERGGFGAGEEMGGLGDAAAAAAASHVHRRVQKGCTANRLLEGSIQEVDLTLSSEGEGEQEEPEQASRGKKGRKRGGARAAGAGLRQSEQQGAHMVEPPGGVSATTHEPPVLAPQARPLAPQHLLTQHAPAQMPSQVAAATILEPPSQLESQSQAGGPIFRPSRSLRDILGLPLKPKKEPQSQAAQEHFTQQQQQQQQLLKHEPQSQQQEQSGVGLQSQQQSAPEVPWDEMLGFNTQMLAQPLPLNTQLEPLAFPKPHPPLLLPDAPSAPAAHATLPHSAHPHHAAAPVPPAAAATSSDAAAPASKAATTAAPHLDPTCPAVVRSPAKAHTGAAPPAVSKGAVQGTKPAPSSAQPSSPTAGTGTQRLQQRKRPRCLADLADMSSSDDEDDDGAVLTRSAKGLVNRVAGPGPHTASASAAAAVAAGHASEASGHGPPSVAPPAPAAPSGFAPAAGPGSRPAAPKPGSGRKGLASLLMGDSDICCAS